MNLFPGLVSATSDLGLVDAIFKNVISHKAPATKFIFLGDPSQIDNPNLNTKYNGLVYLSEKMKGNPVCWQMTFKKEESVRSELAFLASKIL